MKTVDVPLTYEQIGDMIYYLEWKSSRFMKQDVISNIQILRTRYNS